MFWKFKNPQNTIETAKEISRVYHICQPSPLGQDTTQGQFFKRSLTGLNSEFSSPRLVA